MVLLSVNMAASKIIPNKPLLIMLYGFPGAGKTFFVRQLCEVLQAAHVHSDRIRMDLFDTPRYDRQENDVLAQLMDYMTGEFLNAGMSVVYDMNAMRPKQRHQLRELARKHNAQPLLIWMQLDAESAWARINKRDRRRSDDKYAMPLDRALFERICGYMQNPQPTEDYIVVSGKHVFRTQFGTLIKKLHDLKLVTPNEMQHNVARPNLVNLVPQQSANAVHTQPSVGRYDISRRNVTIR